MTPTPSSYPVSCKALQRLNKGVPALIKYLLTTEVANYVLTTKISNDVIEGRFGTYKQLCGGSYSVTVAEVSESEKQYELMYSFKLTKYSTVPLVWKSRLDFRLQTKIGISFFESLRDFVVNVKYPSELHSS